MKLIHLNKNAGFQWYMEAGVFIKGYGFQESNYLCRQDLLNYFKNVKTKIEFKKKLQSLNGMFAVVINLDEQILFAVDHVRSIPLFFTSKYSCAITDSPETLPQALDEISSTQIQSLLLAGFTTGKETLNPNIFQLQSGEYGCFDIQKKNFDVFSYYIHSKIKTSIDKATPLE